MKKLKRSNSGGGDNVHVSRIIQFSMTTTSNPTPFFDNNFYNIGEECSPMNAQILYVTKSCYLVISDNSGHFIFLYRSNEAASK